MRPALLIAAAAALSACAGSGGGPSTLPPGDPAAAGERLYRAHCASCHRLRDPRERTPEAWAGAVARYGPRAHLSAEERQLVLDYLVSRGRDGSGGAR
ncbi:MAG TPA: cytochrome c [Anaeromyxobacteraceae bacterium]